jgi:hypothetical protein
MEQTSRSRTPTMQEMLKYWYTGLSIEIIAERLGTTVNKLYSLRRKYGLPKRSNLNKTGRIEYEPTAEEIAEAAAGVRASWTPAQEMARRVGPKPSTSWTPPTFIYNSVNGLFTPSDNR